MIARARALIRRRVPQVLAVYLGICWGIVEFVSFVEGRYGLSPHWTDLALAGLSLLIPSVVLFTYHHGMPGKDELVRSEKIGIPLNVLVVAAILFVGFSDKELGAVTTEVMVRDETGKTVERVIPKASFRQRLALFNFDGDASDSAVAWLRYGLPQAIATDLAQDMFLDVRTSVFFREKLRQLGFPEEVGVPLSLKRQIAEEQHLPYFVTGTIAGGSTGKSVRLAVHETARGTLVQERTFEGKDARALADEISVAIKEALEIPASPQMKDLPVAELLTASDRAFHDYIEGATALQVRDDWQTAMQRMENAVAADPTFAVAHLTLHNLYLLSNQAQRSLAPLQRAMDHLYRLPERLQYDVKAEYYMMKQDGEKALAVAQMKVDLFPEDISAYLLLAQLQQLFDDKAGRLASLLKVLELDPGRHELLREVGALYESQGDFEPALDYYGRYAERFPNLHGSFVSLAKLHRLRGDHTQARQNYEKALLISPSEVTVMTELAALRREQGEFEAALRQLEEALEAARTAEARAAALEGLAEYYEFRGELGRSLEYAERAIAEMAKFAAPLATAAFQLSQTETYVRAGRTDEARRTVERVAASMQPPFDFIRYMGEVELHLALEEADEAERAVAGLDQAIATLFPFLRSRAVLARGRIAELRGQCDAAVEQYREKARLDPTDAGIHTYMARCQRKLGAMREAMVSAEGTLRIVPFDPRANYELALAHAALGDRVKALHHLRRAVEVWRDADPSFAVATEAKERLRALEAGNP